MQTRSRSETYEDFIRITLEDVKRRRLLVGKKMFSVFLWCFAIPAILAVVMMILIRVGVLPRNLRGMIDGLILVFPVSYGIYALGSEGIREVIGGVRKGGGVMALETSRVEHRWREGICRLMVKNVSQSREEWNWITASFRGDLHQIAQRNKFITILAGAVFFIILHGLDMIAPDPAPLLQVSPDAFFHLLGAGLEKFAQLVALGIFLVLLYQSGSETHHVLEKYLHCAELVAMDPARYR